MRAVLLALVLTVASSDCARQPPPLGTQVRLEATATPEGYRLALIPAAGVRINAHLKPVLELDGGARLQFDAAALTADSASFAVPPTSVFAARSTRLHGILRVGVCPPGLNVCRSLALPVDLALPRS